jgi:hypothetical protein
MPHPLKRTAIDLIAFTFGASLIAIAAWLSLR